MHCPKCNSHNISDEHQYDIDVYFASKCWDCNTIFFPYFIHKIRNASLNVGLKFISIILCQLSGLFIDSPFDALFWLVSLLISFAFLFHALNKEEKVGNGAYFIYNESDFAKYLSCRD